MSISAGISMKSGSRNDSTLVEKLCIDLHRSRKSVSCVPVSESSLLDRYLSGVVALCRAHKTLLPDMWLLRRDMTTRSVLEAGNNEGGTSCVVKQEPGLTSSEGGSIHQAVAGAGLPSGTKRGFICIMCTMLGISTAALFWLAARTAPLFGDFFCLRCASACSQMGKRRCVCTCVPCHTYHCGGYSDVLISISEHGSVFSRESLVGIIYGQHPPPRKGRKNALRAEGRPPLIRTPHSVLPPFQEQDAFPQL